MTFNPLLNNTEPNQDEDIKKLIAEFDMDDYGTVNENGHYLIKRVVQLITQKQLEAEINSIGHLLHDFTNYCDKNNVDDNKVFAELVQFISKRQIDLTTQKGK